MKKSNQTKVGMDKKASPKKATATKTKKKKVNSEDADDAYNDIQEETIRFNSLDLDLDDDDDEDLGYYDDDHF